MSRFIRKAGQTSSALSLNDINQGFKNVYTSTTSGSFQFPDGTTTAKIIATGGGGGGAWNIGVSFTPLCSFQSSGAGGGTVIAYVDVSENKDISWVVGSGGNSCSINNFCCCSIGATGGLTSVSGSGFSITACGGNPGHVFSYYGGACVSRGGCGSASGTLGCMIIQGGPGEANQFTGNNATGGSICNGLGSYRFRGGETYFGTGAVGHVYWYSSCICCGNYACASYGGGGIGPVSGSCYNILGIAGAPGLVYLEYN